VVTVAFDPDAPNITLARMALASFLDQALGARLREIERNREARLEAFHDYLLLIRHVGSLEDSDGRLQALAMTAFDSRTCSIRLHTDRPFALATAYQSYGPTLEPDRFVEELVWLLVSDDLEDPEAGELM
jgi:hypothetical protein